MRTAIASLALLLCASGCCALYTKPSVHWPTALPGETPAANPLHAGGRSFRDLQGGTVVLRGVNVSGSSKLPPFHPLQTDQLDVLPSWGVNVIRLLFIWEAFERDPGHYNDTYLNEILDIADAAWSRGIYVVIDFHQDGFSRFTTGGCGEGFPRWALPRGVRHVAPDNGQRCTDWAVRNAVYCSTRRSFRALYANEEGARDAYLQMVARVVRRAAPHPGIIGYDLINEPQGDECCELPHFYEDLATVIRGIAPDAILFVEPNFWTVPGLLQTHLRRPSFGNFAYAPHFYDSLLMATNRWNRVPWTSAIAFHYMKQRARDWNVPLFVGEFGAPATATNADLYIDLLETRLNEALASGAQWAYTPGWDPWRKDGWNQEDLSIVDDHGRFRAVFKVRPYAQRIAGDLTKLNVISRDPPVVEVAWQHDPSKGTTRIFAPRSLWGHENVVIAPSDPKLTCQFDATETYVDCMAPIAGPLNVRLSSPLPR